MPNLFHVETEEDLQKLAANLAQVAKAGAIIFLYGPLGAGKTTFTRGFLRALGYRDKVKSPTFTLVEPYEIAGISVFHFDFYRLDDAKALEQIGIREYFTPTSICLLEWPEKGFPLLPDPDIACYISFAEPGRDVRIEAHSDRGRKMLAQNK
jgi:tRNA threonylcarbamoyladenosine biosynthesis protein TsaE